MQGNADGVPACRAAASDLVASLGHLGRQKCVLGDTLHTLTLTIADELTNNNNKNRSGHHFCHVLRKFKAVLGCMQLLDHRWGKLVEFSFLLMSEMP